MCKDYCVFPLIQTELFFPSSLTALQCPNVILFVPGFTRWIDDIIQEEGKMKKGINIFQVNYFLFKVLSKKTVFIVTKK